MKGMARRVKRRAEKTQGPSSGPASAPGHAPRKSGPPAPLARRAADIALVVLAVAADGVLVATNVAGFRQ